ncbi:MAG: hypothetical protein ACT4P5_12950, partial [Armatimonadota bacterium]
VEAGPVLTVRYVGDIHGARANAVVTYERLPEVVAMAGRIQSGSYTYTFKADIVGNAGFGDMLDHSNNTRFRIHVRLTPDGFALTSNPQGPGVPTTYYFKKQ